MEAFLDYLFTGMEQLQYYPLSGSALENKTEIPTKIRYLVVENYLIFYEPLDEVINVYRILYTK